MNTAPLSLLALFVLLPALLTAATAAVRCETYGPNTSAANDQFRTWTLRLSYFIKGYDLKLTLNYLPGDPAGPFDSQGRLVAQAQVIF